jgi:hypothetical protein
VIAPLRERDGAGTVVYLPAAAEGESKWLTADVSGVLLDMTQAQPTKR